MQLGLLKPEIEAQLNVGNVWKLRNQNIQPDGTNSFGPTPLGERFIEAFTEDAPGFAGFRERTPLPSDAPDALTPGSGFVGYPSNIYPSPMGRQFLAEKLRARFSAGPARLSLHLGTKIVRLLFEETPTGPRVIGVVAQPRYGGEVVYRAGKKVILAAGIFGTFSLLVDSGIGPREALDTRGVATADRVIENCHIGKEVGDEVFVTCLFVAAKDQGGRRRMAAWRPSWALEPVTTPPSALGGHSWWCGHAGFQPSWRSSRGWGPCSSSCFGPLLATGPTSPSRSILSTQIPGSPSWR